MRLTGMSPSVWASRRGPLGLVREEHGGSTREAAVGRQAPALAAGARGLIPARACEAAIAASPGVPRRPLHPAAIALSRSSRSAPIRSRWVPPRGTSPTSSGLRPAAYRLRSCRPAARPLPLICACSRVPTESGRAQSTAQSARGEGHASSCTALARTAHGEPRDAARARGATEAARGADRVYLAEGPGRACASPAAASR